MASWRDLLKPPAPFEPALEATYWADHAARHAPHRRALLLLAICGGVVTLGWGALMGRLEPRLAALHGAGLVLLLVLLWLARGARFAASEAYASACLVLGTAALLFGACLLVWLAPAPDGGLDHVYALLVPMVFAAGPLHLRAREVSLCMALGALAALAGAVQALCPWALCACMLAIAMVGVVVGAQQEHAARLSFLRQQALLNANQAMLRCAGEAEQLATDVKASLAQAEARWHALLALQEQLRGEAEQRDRDKSALLATAVHDLRQPVQAIGNVLEPLSGALARNDPAAAGQLVQLARRALAVLRDQLSAIQDLARLESGALRPVLAPVALRELVGQAVAGVAPLAQRQGVDVQSDWALPPACLVRSDARFLESILAQLLSNAVKFQAATGPRWARVTARAEDGVCVVEVSDGGQGIAADLLSSGAIFRPFAQFNHPQPEADKGVGLGLAIVKAMLALLPGHALDVRSEPGQGSCFSLRLPIEAGGGPAQPQPLPAAAELQGSYLLLVEDDDLVRNSTAALLASHGLLVEVADSHEAACDLVQTLERFPDVLVCDYRLPRGHTAIDVAREVNARFGPVPLVVFSGETMDFAEVEAICGAPVLRKPVAVRDLFAAIAQAMR